MRKKVMNKYLFRGSKIEATSKEAIMRRFGLKNNDKNKALITIIKPMGETK